MTAHGPSNGTMGAMWTDAWCFRCVNDHGFSHVEDSVAEEGCPLLLRLYVEDGPFNFLVDVNDERAWDPTKLVCSQFSRCPCDDPRGFEPAELAGPPLPVVGLVS